MARKDYTDRRRRQAQGIAAAKTAGLYRGRKADAGRHAGIVQLIGEGKSWSQVTALTGASRSTIKRALDAHKASQGAAQ